MTVRSIPFEDMIIVGQGDSSWANTSELRCQAGVMIFFCDRAVLSLSGGRASLVFWRSTALKRRCTSTLAAESQANKTLVDALVFVRALMCEILYEPFLVRRDGLPAPDMLESVVCTDCRSLYDLLVRDGSLATVSEKRTAIDIACVVDVLHELLPSDKDNLNQEADLRDIVKWVPTHLLYADHLTKVQRAEKLMNILSSGRMRLRGRVEDLKNVNFCQCHRPRC